MSAPRPENMRSPAKAWLRALEATAPIERGQAPILPLLIDTLAERFEQRRRRLEPLGQSVDERSEEHTSELQSRFDLVCRLLLEKKNSILAYQQDYQSSILLI